MRSLQKAAANYHRAKKSQAGAIRRLPIESLEDRVFLSATLTEYTTATAFSSATSGLTNINFASAVKAGQVITGYSTAAGLTLSGVKFVAPYNTGGGYHLYATTPAYNVAYTGFTGNPDVLQGAAGAGGYFGEVSPGKMVITLPANTTEVGFNVYDFLNTATSFTVSSGGTSKTYSVAEVAKPNLAFFGVTSTAAISTITMVSGKGDVANIANFAFGSGAVKPATGRIFITSGSTSSPARVGEYNASGSVINANLISLGANDTYDGGIAVSGSYVFVTNFYGGTVGEYTTSGATINAKLISGFPAGTGPFGVAVSGSKLFVALGNGGAAIANGGIAEYTLGATPGTIASSNPKFVTGLDDVGSIAVSGSNLFVTDYALGTIDEFTTSGAKVKAPLVSGLTQPEAVAVSGSDLFVSEYSAGIVGEYTTSGAVVNKALLSGIPGPYGLGASSSDLFLNTAGQINEYTTKGVLVKAGFITGLTSPKGVLFVGSATTTTPSLVFKSQPTKAGVGTPIATPITVENLDASGKPVTTASTVTLSVLSGPVGGIVTGTLSAITVKGIATFTNLSFSKAGTYVLKAVDGTLTVNSASITVGSSLATKLAVASQPTTVVAGKVLAPIKINVETAAGALVKTDTSTVTLSIASGPAGGKLTGLLTATVVNGVATFNNLSLTVAGTYKFKAVDGTLTAVTTKSVVVTAAPAAKLVISKQPTTDAPGTPLTAVVADIEDAFGNIVTTATSTVAIAIATGPVGGKLTGVASVKAVKGVATFTGLGLSKAGSYTLNVTDGALTPAVSKPIVVKLPPPAKVVFIAPPQTGKSGTKLPALTVDIESALGVLETTATSTVKLTLAGGPTGGKLSGTLSAKAVGGVATFSNVILKPAGTYTVEASDGTLTVAMAKIVVK
jgi:hypothetical protein